MLPLWRLTRNRYGRALYEALAARGISATKMYRYEGRIDAAPPARDPPADVAVDAVLDAVRRGRTAARGRLSPKRSTCASTPGTRIWASARCCDRGPSGRSAVRLARRGSKGANGRTPYVRP